MRVENLIPKGETAERFMTTGEVAVLCRTSPETVRWWRHVGKGPGSFRCGRRVLYPAAEVQRWLTELQSQDTPSSHVVPAGSSRAAREGEARPR